MKKILKNNAVQSLIASLLCIILGLFIGYIVLLFINPEGAWDAILAVLKNFLKTLNALCAVLLQICLKKLNRWS